MQYKRLYILVEGNDDERFFRRLIKLEFEKIYHSVLLYRYAEQPPKKIENFMKSIVSMNADYIVITDINHSPCISHRKETLKKKKMKSELPVNNRITVAIREIESWYFAGLDAAALKELGIPYRDKKTDALTKEQFDRLIPGRFVSRIDFMQEILKNFQLQTAVQKNKSFRYFVEKYNLG